jgi:hypothetical protein
VSRIRSTTTCSTGRNDSELRERRVCGSNSGLTGKPGRSDVLRLVTCGVHRRREVVVGSGDKETGLIMALMRIELGSDKYTARRVQQLYQAGKVHHESRDAAREEVWRRGRTPAGEPVFVGITNGEPFRLIYDVDVYPDTTR